MPTAHQGGSSFIPMLRVNGKLLKGEELREYTKEGDKEYWDIVKKEMQGGVNGI